MQRNVTAADVAETIFSLITSNPFVTGETVVIDGGYAATSWRRPDRCRQCRCLR